MNNICYRSKARPFGSYGDSIDTSTGNFRQAISTAKPPNLIISSGLILSFLIIEGLISSHSNPKYTQKFLK